MKEVIKATIIKILPLAILYLLFIISFLGKSDYESIIVLIAVIPLAIYIFTKNSKLKKYLQYLLYLFIVGIIIYWAIGTYGLLHGWLYGYYSPSMTGFSCFFKGCHGETGWNIFTQSALFTDDLKMLFYIGIIFLAVKNRKRQ